MQKTWREHKPPGFFRCSKTPILAPLRLAFLLFRQPRSIMGVMNKTSKRYDRSRAEKITGL
jgi:hypothetical protein